MFTFLVSDNLLQHMYCMYVLLFHYQSLLCIQTVPPVFTNKYNIEI